jgi:hypothetical protein
MDLKKEKGLLNLSWNFPFATIQEIGFTKLLKSLHPNVHVE